MGQTTDFWEFVDSNADIAPVGRGRLRVKGGIVQSSVNGGAWGPFTPQATSKYGVGVLRPGADLIDADQTISPGTDKASIYVFPGPLTANRNLTVTNTGSPPFNKLCVIRSFDTSAFTVTIKDDTAAVLYTLAASPGAGMIRDVYLYFNPGTGHFAFFGDMVELQ